MISALVDYVMDQCSTNDDLSHISKLLADDGHACVGLILTERLVNVPAQVVPPMYRMLQEEITWALDDNEPYKFTHFLILSKTYREIASRLDEDETSSRKAKKQRQSGRNGSDELFYFHPEDELLQRHAVAYGGYGYKNRSSQSDSKRAFQELGIKPQGHMMLIECGKFESALKAMQTFVGQD